MQTAVGKIKIHGTKEQILDFNTLFDKFGRGDEHFPIDGFFKYQNKEVERQASKFLFDDKYHTVSSQIEIRFDVDGCDDAYEDSIMPKIEAVYGHLYDVMLETSASLFSKANAMTRFDNFYSDPKFYIDFDVWESNFHDVLKHTKSRDIGCNYQLDDSTVTWLQYNSEYYKQHPDEKIDVRPKSNIAASNLVKYDETEKEITAAAMNRYGLSGPHEFVDMTGGQDGWLYVLNTIDEGGAETINTDLFNVFNNELYRVFKRTLNKESFNSQFLADKKRVAKILGKYTDESYLFECADDFIYYIREHYTNKGLAKAIDEIEKTVFY